MTLIKRCRKRDRSLHACTRERPTPAARDVHETSQSDARSHSVRNAAAIAIAVALSLSFRSATASEPANGGNAYTSAFDSMTQSDLTAHIAWLADPDREGRGTPSVGLSDSAL